MEMHIVTLTVLVFTVSVVGGFVGARAMIAYAYRMRVLHERLVKKESKVGWGEFAFSSRPLHHRASTLRRKESKDE